MKKTIKLLATMLAALTLVLSLSSVGAADTEIAFSAAVTDLSLVDTGTVIPVFEDTWVEVTTLGEVNQATITCLDAACLGLGFHGATITTTHNSELKIDLNTGALRGELEGIFTLEALSGAVISGDLEAVVSGLAWPVDGTFAFLVEDAGKWEAEAIEAEGTLDLAVSGLLGGGLSGEGTFGGTVVMDEGN